VHSDFAVRVWLYVDVAGRRLGRVRLARALIFLKTAAARLTCPGCPEDEEVESVQMYLREARDDGDEEQR
jgi:uncharacterized protein YlaN (UPF0358 family)